MTTSHEQTPKARHVTHHLVWEHTRSGSFVKEGRWEWSFAHSVVCHTTVTSLALQSDAATSLSPILIPDSGQRSEACRLSDRERVLRCRCPWRCSTGSSVTKLYQATQKPTAMTTGDVQGRECVAPGCVHPGLHMCSSDCRGTMGWRTLHHTCVWKVSEAHHMRRNKMRKNQHSKIEQKVTVSV